MRCVICRITCIFSVFLTILFMSCCKNESTQISEEEEALSINLTNTIEAVLGKKDSGEAKISGLINNDSSLQGILADNKTGRLISDSIEYHIEDILIKDTVATASVYIKSPDVYKIITNIADEKNIEDTDTLLEEVEACLKVQEYPTIEKTVSCDMVFQDGCWYLIPNSELVDMLSGHLYDYYTNLGYETVNMLVGGIENEN